MMNGHTVCSEPHLAAAWTWADGQLSGTHWGSTTGFFLKSLLLIENKQTKASYSQDAGSESEAFTFDPLNTI